MTAAEPGTGRADFRAAHIVTVEGPRCTCALATTAGCVTGLRAWIERRMQAAVFLDDPALESVAESGGRALLRGVLALEGGPLGVEIRLGRSGFDGDPTPRRAARARADLGVLAEARHRGIPTLEAWAAGEIRDPGAGPRRFLLTASTARLHRLSAGAVTRAQARELGRFLRTAHDAGLHAPLGAEHLQFTAADRPLLTDAAGAWFAEPPDDEERADLLALWTGGFDGLTEGPCGTALLDGYAAGLALRERSFRRARRARQRLLTRAGREALRDGPVVAASRTADGARWFHARGLDPSLRAEVEALAPAAGQPPAEAAELRRRGRRGAVWLGERVVVKERDAAHGRRLFVAAHWLRAAGVPCPTPLALRQHRGRALVAVGRLPGADLAERCADPATAPDTADACRLAGELGRSVGRLHGFGLRNRDLKLENLMPCEDGRVAMVDLDGVVRRRILDHRGEGRDLGRLRAAWAQLGRADEARVVRAFWRGYHRARSCLAHPTVKRLRRRIAERAREWAAAHPPRPA